MIVLIAVLTGCSNGTTGGLSPSQRVVLKLGTETAINTPETRGSQKLADLVKEKSKGTLTIEVFEDAKLGSMKERAEGMRMGTIDMGTSSVGFLASFVPVLGIFDLPYRRCGYFLGLFYATHPKFRRYSKGLIAPSDILIRFSLYQCR